jgi:hypothetical protein
MPEMETTDKVMDPNVLTIPRDGDTVRIQFKMSLTSAPTTPIAWSHPDERNAVHVDSNGELIKTDTIDQAVCKMMELRQSDDHYEFVVISLSPPSSCRTNLPGVQVGGGMLNRRLEYYVCRCAIARHPPVLTLSFCRMHLGEQRIIEIPADDAFVRVQHCLCERGLSWVFGQGADGLGNVVPPNADLIYGV